MNKPFKNRMTQEDTTTINKLKRTYINMNNDKITTPNTPDGLFFISIQPNNQVDEVRLESDLKFILGHYYRWRYGSKFTSLKHLQYKFNGIIERQQGYHNHLHLILYTLNIEELTLFLGYIKKVFKTLYSKCSFDFQCIYDYEGCEDYISINNHRKLRTSQVVVICDDLFK